MTEYTVRYKFKKKEVTAIPQTVDVTRIIDEKFRIDVDTFEIIKEYKLRPEVIPVLSIPLVYDDLTKSFKITKYARIESLSMGYYYATEPSALTTTQPDYLRIDSDRSLITKARLQAWDGSNWVNLRVQSSDYPNLRVSIYDNGSLVESIDGNTDGKAATKVCLAVGSYLFGFNGSSWDRVRTHMTMDLGTFTATGAGSSVDTLTGFDKWTWVIITDASATSATVRLEGSIDNEYWFALDEWTGTGNTMRHVVNKPVRYVRANVVDMGDATSITVKAFGMR